MKCHARFGYLFLILLGLPGVCGAEDWRLSLYGGRMSSESWENAILIDVGLIVAAGAWTFKRYLDGALSIELEAQAGRYFGDQDHWEFNMPVAALRWDRFPWQRRLDTTLAWGIGPSFATNIPAAEVAISGSSQQWLVYWFAELTVGPPQSNWALLLRLHHRSGAYKLVAEAGRSNTVTAGVTYRF